MTTLGWRSWAFLSSLFQQWNSSGNGGWDKEEQKNTSSAAAEQSPRLLRTWTAREGASLKEREELNLTGESALASTVTAAFVLDAHEKPLGRQWLSPEGLKKYEWSLQPLLSDNS